MVRCLVVDAITCLFTLVSGNQRCCCLSSFAGTNRSPTLFSLFLSVMHKCRWRTRCSSRTHVFELTTVGNSMSFTSLSVSRNILAAARSGRRTYANLISSKFSTSSGHADAASITKVSLSQPLPGKSNLWSPYHTFMTKLNQQDSPNLSMLVQTMKNMTRWSPL